ncbi:hypothetical protein [Embleya sp. NBC_00896]|uniref:hypothetical protein n=1 Tax=Embleya sp. NBC_00896 TaxID=2975961 RepID=UPI00386302CE|nr:hypothetical protein OG928_26440 [Embleya sp. NBC_00896]
MNAPTRAPTNDPVRYLLPAATGWLAFAALELPAGHPLRVLVVVAFLAVGPGFAVAGAGPNRLSTAVTAVVTSAALGALTAEAYLLAGTFSGPRVLGTLAGLTTTAALIRTAAHSLATRGEIR